MLANIALKSAGAIIGRNLASLGTSLLSLSAFLARCPDLFEWTAPQAGVVG